MHIRKLTKNPHPLSKEYRFFACLLIISVFLTLILLLEIFRRDHKKVYNKEYLSLSFAAANNFEFFLNNIFRQAEFIGHKIPNHKKRNDIDGLLKHNFSLDSKIDVYSLGSWIKFDWIDKADSKFNDYNLIYSKKEPWSLQFGSLHKVSTNSNDHFLPITFGITDRNDRIYGIIAGNINISALVKFLHDSLQKESLSIIVLDNDKTIVGQYNKNSEISLPQDFFKNLNFLKTQENIYQKFDITNTVFLAYRTLDKYPFTIVIGDKEEIVFKFFQGILLDCCIILLLFLIPLLTIFSIFYRRILNPLFSLSSFAKNILYSDTNIEYFSKGYDIEEISNLEKILINISKSNKNIYFKNREQENKIEKLEQEIKKHYNSYRIINNITNELSSNKETNPKTAIQECLLAIYPEIYFRQINIIESISETPKLDIKYKQFTKIVLNLLLRSIYFSAKNSNLIIQTQTKIIDGNKHFCLTIEDNGIGEEAWRNKNANNQKQFEESKKILEENGGILKQINKEESGIKYYILLPYNHKNKTTQNNKIIFFPTK